MSPLRRKTPRRDVRNNRHRAEDSSLLVRRIPRYAVGIHSSPTAHQRRLIIIGDRHRVVVQTSGGRFAAVRPDPGGLDRRAYQRRGRHSSPAIRRARRISAARRDLLLELPLEQRANVMVATPVGLPSAEIIKYARDHQVDLIVMGTHGRGALGHVLLGSVAERVVRKAPCAVLTVRRAASA